MRVQNTGSDRLNENRSASFRGSGAVMNRGKFRFPKAVVEAVSLFKKVDSVFQHHHFIFPELQHAYHYLIREADKRRDSRMSAIIM